MSQNRQMPDFLIIGAGKSGTTSLDIYLDSHPSIFMSKRKDPGFFASEQYEITEDMLPESKAYYEKFINIEEDYSALFRNAEENQIKGETSTIYLYSGKGYLRIKERIPNVKLIAILRQPAERLYSRYLHLARENLLPTKDFQDIFDKSSIWWHRPDLIQEGFYFKHLSRFYKIFPKENIKVFLYDDLKHNSQELFSELFRFLEVEHEFKPITDVAYNQSGIIKNKFVNRLIGYNNPIFNLTKSFFPKQFESLKRNPTAQKLISKIRSKNLEKPSMDITLNQKIMDTIYNEDVSKLENLIEKDLTSWKNPS